MEKRRLEEIEQFIFSQFEKRDASRLLTKEIFESTDFYPNGDLVRAFEDLEKRWRLLVRYTKDGSDWISLTPEGADYVGVRKREGGVEPLPHPPNSIAPELGS